MPYTGRSAGGVKALDARRNDGYTAYEYAVDTGSSAIKEIILQHSGFLVVIGTGTCR
jgi:hypothetical protein